jgi:hypothetical protein
MMLHRIHHGPPVGFDWFHAHLERGVLRIPKAGLPGTTAPAGVA